MKSKMNPVILSRFFILYTISGFVVVAMETVWIRTLSLIIGNTVAAATAAICVFFVFAAIGNLIGGRLAAKVKKTAYWYGLAEIGFAFSAFLLYPCSSFLPLSKAIVGYFSLANYISSAVILVGIPSLLAGISLPLLLQSFVWRSDARTGTGGLFYAGNLLGAASGVICGGIVLPLFFGFKMTVAIISVLGICEGLFAMIWSRQIKPPDADQSFADKKKDKSKLTDPEIDYAGGYAILAASGILGLGIELLMLQYFRQFSTGSLYTISAVLFAFLIGISAGSFCASLARKTRYTARQLLTFFLWTSAILCAVYTFVFHTVMQHSLEQGGFIGNRDVTLTGFAVLTIFKTTAMMLPLLVCTGAIFPLAWEITEKGVVHQGTFFGKAVFVNKLGCALGTILIPFAIVPWLGLNRSLLAIGLGFILVVLFLDIKLFSVMRKKSFASFLRALALIIIAAFFYKSYPSLALNPGERLLGLYQGAGTTTAVIEDEKKSRHIVLNQHYILNGTQHALLSQQNESWIPLSLCGHPGRTAFIGVASGISATAALDFPIDKLDAVEIVPDVAKAARIWFQAWNKALFEDKRSSVIIEDGRRVIAAAKEQYDCVICDLVLPGGEGTNDLYSKDFFNIVKNKLNVNGIFCLWLPMYQMDEELAGMVIKTFASVYPCAIAVRGNLDPLQNTIGLIGSSSQIDLSSETIQKRLAAIPAISAIRQSVFFRSEANFRLMMVGDLAVLKNNLSDFPIITDNRPVFAFRGPKPIPDGKVLRALTYLNWSNQMFLFSEFPSCSIGSTKADELQSGLRAGNYYYAAAISSVALPVSPEKQSQRYLQTLNYIKTAKEFSPLSDVDIEK